IASLNKKSGQELAHSVGRRFILFEALYSTMHDVLVVCAEEKPEDSRKHSGGVHAGYLKPGMTVMDLTATATASPLLQEARLRGCVTVSPRDLLLNQLDQQVRVLTGKTVARADIEKAIPERFREEME